ncbi:hypothetical protein [Schnuerera sp.]|uniref:hypothetical protein n=1 Tax=Schnuerera sp. TaxID=2794844 RepID=UPI002BE834B6|nr:hypothetical protein [Schnuerera sp.]HSH36447.1 hypothetical protein [Schnuerera sp.]
MDILNKKHGNEITKELGDKITDIEYYIGNQKLLKSTIYSLNNQPKGELKHFYFEFNGKYYTMMVDGNFRSINYNEINMLVV